MKEIRTPFYRLVFDWFELPFATYRAWKCSIQTAERMLDIMDEMPGNRRNKLPIKLLRALLILRVAFEQ